MSEPEVSKTIVWYQANYDANGDRHRPKHKGIGPLRWIELRYREGFPADKHNHDLGPNHDQIDDNKEPVAKDSFENIELIVSPT